MKKLLLTLILTTPLTACLNDEDYQCTEGQVALIDARTERCQASSNMADDYADCLRKLKVTFCDLREGVDL